MQQPVATHVTFADTTANPAPLGLSAFGLTTILLNVHNAGVYPLDAMILAMGIFYGGLAQVVAGIMEWRKGNSFGTTAFTSYGFFWLSLGGILIMPAVGLGEAPGPVAMGTYLGLWGLFTAALFVGTLRIGRGLQSVFLTLTVLFLLLAAADFTGSDVLLRIAGLEGILCGATAVYVGLGQLLNEVYGRTLVPV